MWKISSEEKIRTLEENKQNCQNQLQRQDRLSGRGRILLDSASGSVRGRDRSQGSRSGLGSGSGSSMSGLSVRVGVVDGLVWMSERGTVDDKKACGRKYRVRFIGGANKAPHPCHNGESVVVTVVDFCQPPCNGILNLSQDAFDVIVDRDAGKVRVEYTLVEALIGN
ncbi:hypothetical protein Dsin_008765 [Dipteronia sinensis]|uniref:Expansin-like EG45 domain-containing protein n=1 Tax=Dipteronia sinensis TaxID=43782 RepID=A0AAE0ECV1_9ROSI|nr:hypothetical protein Dsin_008765 [Dipteronia sinensis]